MQKLKLLFLVVIITSCNKENRQNENVVYLNKIEHSKGFSLVSYKDVSVVEVINPWPNSTQNYKYVLYKNKSSIPDSLKKYKAIKIPLQKIVVTSTTHIPSLEMLNVESTLCAFPNTNYVSSVKTRELINKGKVREIGSNQDLNTEVLLELQPDVIIGFGIDNSNKTFSNLEKNGLNVMYNGDWTEESPLGKAEWIKFFGALYDKNNEAEKIFNTIKKDYLKAKKIASKTKQYPTILCGAIYENQWYLPKGDSWASLFLKDAYSNYLWKETIGKGSLSLSFETVLDKAQNADFWIGPGQFTSLNAMLDSNDNYKHFKAFKNKTVYSFSSKKGATGGVIYYELASNRPDLVLKDLIKITHPELLPDYQLYFFEKLK